MAATFGALKARIQAEVNRPSTAYLSPIGDAILTAIRFYEAKPIYFTETKDTLTLESGDNFVTLPNGFKRMISLRILVNGTYRGVDNGFVGVSYSQLEEVSTDPTLSQTPDTWALLGNRIYFNCLADQDYTLSIVFNIGDETPVSADSDISIWFEEGQDIIRLEAMGIFYADKLHSPELGQTCKAEAMRYYDNLVQRNVERSSSNGLI